MILMKVGLRSDPPVWEKTAQQLQAGGRPSILEYEGASPEYRLPSRCTVTTVGAKLPQTKYVEIAEVVFIHPSQPEAQLCAAAKELANEAFTKLPK